jgi:hypothetical protein
MLPDSQFIFKYGRIVTVSLGIAVPSGALLNCELPLADESAMLVTKSKSMATPKRRRDIFDIFMAVAHCRDIDGTIHFFKNILQHERADIYNTLFQIAVNVYLDEEADGKILEFALRPDLIPPAPSNAILEFLAKTGINLEEAEAKAAKERDKRMPFGKNVPNESSGSTVRIED